MNKRIYLSPPHLTPDAMAYLKEAVESNWIAPVGPDVDAFERELATILRVSHVLVTNSGTSAIHLGLLALGVGKGDEVLCSTFTFCASVNPVIYCGATPVFVDSEKQTWNMDPLLLEEAIIDRIKTAGKKPKAIIVVHLYGMPARMKELIEVSRRYEIPVLEDAAEALGSFHKGSPLGTLGDVGILSFNGNKIVTTSGGGAIFSSRLDVIERARYLRQEAKEPVPYYEHKEVGYNYRLSNLLAALGRSQLKVLAQRVARRREIFDIYFRESSSIPSVSFQEELDGMQSNRWLSTILIGDDDPETLRVALEHENIESRRVWKPMHLQPVFENYPAYLNAISERLFKDGLCLPSGTEMKMEFLQHIVQVIKRTLK